MFRTYLATTVVKNYLIEHDNIKTKSANEKLYHAKLANLEAAPLSQPLQACGSLQQQWERTARDIARLPSKCVR